MRISRGIVFLAALAAFAVAGCSTDVAGQLASNPQMREQVLSTIAGNKELAIEAVDRVIANDSLRVEVVDHLLQNDHVAAQLLDRIATNDDATAVVIGLAVQDSSMARAIATMIRRGKAMSEAKRL